MPWRSSPASTRGAPETDDARNREKRVTTNGFQPDFGNVVDAARNKRAQRLPIYEHGIDFGHMGTIVGGDLTALYQGNLKERREFTRLHNEFYRVMGYDIIPVERGLCGIVQGGEGLIGTAPGLITSRDDFDEFPFDTGVEDYFALWAEDLDLGCESIPEGMALLGGVGNGIFEVVQDLVGYTNLCLMKFDDPELYADLFQTVGDLSVKTWKRFLDSYGDHFAVCRFGDDLGFKSSTLLSPGDIREHLIPQYKRIVDLVHSYGKPFLLHSCGNIFAVMEDLIDTVGIDAKHSNEDEIAPFGSWVEQYGDRIGIFGGIDVSVLCESTPEQVRLIVHSILEETDGNGGIAASSGNSIPNYVPIENYVAMVAAIREYRGESLPAGWPWEPQTRKMS